MPPTDRSVHPLKEYYSAKTTDGIERYIYHNICHHAFHQFDLCLDDLTVADAEWGIVSGCFLFEPTHQLTSPRMLQSIR